MAKGDMPVGRVVATFRQDKSKKYEIGVLFRTGKYDGQYSLMLSTTTREPSDPKYPKQIPAAKVLERAGEFFLDIRLTKDECERLRGGGNGGGDPFDSAPAGGEGGGGDDPPIDF